jgi:hypothetical protein
MLSRRNILVFVEGGKLKNLEKNNPGSKRDLQNY